MTIFMIVGTFLLLRGSSIRVQALPQQDAQIRIDDPAIKNLHREHARANEEAVLRRSDHQEVPGGRTGGGVPEHPGGEAPRDPLFAAEQRNDPAASADAR
ncbi:MAG: hypothetical protein AB4911_08940 [Oscillochloridaceae bacterium umkhey_bin13]